MADQTGQTGKPYDLNQLYRQAFGHIRPPYPVLVRRSQELGISPIGSIKALKGSFSLKSSLNAEYTLPIKMDGYQFPQEPSVRIKGGSNIIQTALNRGERVQNVLEEVNLNNYEITIKGVIVNEDDFEEYPELPVRRIREICEKPGAVEIENGLTTIWGITQVKIKDFEFSELRGFPGAQSFMLECLSDQPFELELLDEPERL